ncbi:MAG: thioesterase, partial [Streptomycetaceae bacterium]|nr:thioesterase [Streptomycetaceae bacterium]
LLLGAYPAAPLTPPLGELPALDDTALARRLIGLGGMSSTLLAYPQWLKAAADVVRDDLRVCHSAGFAPDESPLPVPLDVFAGTADPLLPLARARAWARHTTRGCRVHEVPGGHFFAHDPAVGFPAVLRRILSESPLNPR